MKKFILLAPMIILLIAGCDGNEKAKPQTPSIKQDAQKIQSLVQNDTNKSDYSLNQSSTIDKIYINEKYKLQVTLPDTWEILDNNPNEPIKYSLSFRDKKYNSGFEWPGLNISYETQPEGLAGARLFELNQMQNNIITIYFSLGKNHIKATCSLYAETKAENDLVLTKCNKVITTLTFIK